jgi:hypothetical protein
MIGEEKNKQINRRLLYKYQRVELLWPEGITLEQLSNQAIEVARKRAKERPGGIWTAEITAETPGDLSSIGPGRIVIFQVACQWPNPGYIPRKLPLLNSREYE